MNIKNPTYCSTFLPKENITEQKMIYPTTTQDMKTLYYTNYNRYSRTIDFMSVDISDLYDVKMHQIFRINVNEKEQELMEKYNEYVK